MNDYNSDQAKELRRARLLKVKPKAAPTMLTESEFNREYVEYRFVAMEHLADLEETNNVLFCPACAKDVNNVMGKRRVLHICYEDDPLGNFPLIAVAKCQGCEWEEMIPVVKQELTQDEQQLLRRFHNAQAATRISHGPLISPHGPALNPNVWSDSMMDALKYQPGALMRIGQDSSNVVFTPPDPARLGQKKADRAWADLAKSEAEQRDLDVARMQLDRIEQIEADQRAKTQSRAAAKNVAIGQMYGMGPTRMQDIARQYQNMAGQQMASQIDKYMMDQMRNMSFTEEEIKTLKHEPAEAAKAAHRVLLDKIKVVFKK